MTQWIAFKDLLAGWSGLDRDALHILAGLALLFAAALVLRRPIANILPWLAVLAAALANEAVSGFADGRFEAWELTISLHDLWVVMLVPTMLALMARLAPRLYAWPRPQIPSRTLLLIEAAPSRSEPVDADYVEIDAGDGRD